MNEEISHKSKVKLRGFCSYLWEHFGITKAENQGTKPPKTGHLFTQDTILTLGELLWGQKALLKTAPIQILIQRAICAGQNYKTWEELIFEEKEIITDASTDFIPENP